MKNLKTQFELEDMNVAELKAEELQSVNGGFFGALIAGIVAGYLIIAGIVSVIEAITGNDY